MLGGGTFTAQNKVLPGAYINFVSARRASAELSDRGIVTMPLELDWGEEDAVFAVTPADIQKDSLRIFGYDYSNDKMKGLRDLFANNIRMLYAYRLNSGGDKAVNIYASAKYGGTRGNALNVVIAANADESTKFDVSLYLDGVKVDEQIGVDDAAALIDNDYVVWVDTAELEVTAGTPFTGGTNGTVTGESYQAYLSAIENYSFNTMGAVTTDNTTKALIKAFCQRMRDQQGVKFQAVLYDYASADYEGIISVMNKPSGATGTAAAELVYWVTGAEGSCSVNRTLLNQKYSGEYSIDTAYTQAQLEDAIQAGKFAFHSVNGDVRVLCDINTYVSDSDEKAKELFGENQSIRVIDQIANDIAVLFNSRYLGQVPNDEAGRISLWNDIVKHHQSLQTIRAIEEFDPDDVKVEQGTAKNAVVVESAVTVVNAMSKLYMTVTVA